MIEKNLSEFSNNAAELIKNAVTNDDFVTIKTNDGNAVLISETEWNFMIESIKSTIANT